MPRRLAALAALLVALAAPAGARAQPSLSVTVDPVTFFDDEAAWLLSVRPTLGFDDGGELWPQLGLGAGYVFPSHLLLALTFDGRLTEPHHLRLGGRVGALFRRQVLDVGFGTGLSLLAVPALDEIGPVPTLWFELRLRLSAAHRLSLLAEADVLVEQLGFARNRGQFGVGLGWTLVF